MDATVVPSTYATAIIESGGIPVILPPEDGVPDVIRALDGLVISGGPDIDPSHMGLNLIPTPKTPTPRRTPEKLP